MDGVGRRAEPMRVLVAYATKNGSTTEIADEIGEGLRARGLDADVKRAKDVRDLSPYGAVVLGSAVYIGRWRPEARRFARRHAKGLRERPCWLFGSGPIGGPAAASRAPPARDEVRLKGRLHARAYATFGGKLTEATPGVVARSLVKQGRIGDFRDFAVIRAWAEAVGDEIRGAASAA